jgi:hypothetical protein
MSSAELFWAKVDRSNRDGCWPWLAAKSEGYGFCKWNGKTSIAHRVAYEIANQCSAMGMVVRHTCDNSACCNPSHLVLGSHADNVADRVERGRSATGQSHGRWKGPVVEGAEKPRLVRVDRLTEVNALRAGFNGDLGCPFGIEHDGRWYALAEELEAYRQAQL